MSVIFQLQPWPALVDTTISQISLAFKQRTGLAEVTISHLPFPPQTASRAERETHIDNISTDAGCQQPPKSAPFINCSAGRYYRFTSITDLKWISRWIWTFPTLNTSDTFPKVCVARLCHEIFLQQMLLSMSCEWRWNEPQFHIFSFN